MSRRYKTDFQTGEHEFFTDNGLELRQRILQGSKREASYYPMQSTAIVRDSKKSFQLTVLSRQVSGVTSDVSGSLEIMLHRNLGQDDGRGLSEPVQDSSSTSTTHWIVFGSVKASETRRRMLSIMLEHPLK